MHDLHFDSLDCNGVGAAVVLIDDQKYLNQTKGILLRTSDIEIGYYYYSSHCYCCCRCFDYRILNRFLDSCYCYLYLPLDLVDDEAVAVVVGNARNYYRSVGTSI
jgi:hypothetical protein